LCCALMLFTGGHAHTTYGHDSIRMSETPKTIAGNTPESTHRVSPALGCDNHPLTCVHRPRSLYNIKASTPRLCYSEPASGLPLQCRPLTKPHSISALSAQLWFLLRTKPRTSWSSALASSGSLLHGLCWTAASRSPFWPRSMRRSIKTGSRLRSQGLCTFLLSVLLCMNEPFY
jgi:hypothetical protein